MPILGITMDTVTMQPRLTRPGIAMGIVGFTPLCKSMQGCAGWCLFVCVWVWVCVCVCVCQIVIVPDCETDHSHSLRGRGQPTDFLPPEEVPLTDRFRAFMHRSRCPLAIYKLSNYYYIPWILLPPTWISPLKNIPILWVISSYGWICLHWNRKLLCTIQIPLYSSWVQLVYI